MSTQTYKYTPLAWRRQIRLLKLHPAASPDDLGVSIDLVPFLLDAAPPFEALSYVWGVPIPKCEILCSGRRAEIGPSLYSALLHMRRLQPLGKSPWIWADAICINQDDTSEREAQVRMMGEIYSRASSTIIWLGEGDDHITCAFDWLAAFGTTLKPLMESLEIAGLMDFAQSHALRAILSEDNHSKAKDIQRTVFGNQLTRNKAFEDIWVLLHRPWFTRKWVIQEVFKSKAMSFVAGDRLMPFVWLNYWFLFLKTSTFSRTDFFLLYPWGLDPNTHDDTNAQAVYTRGTILSLANFRSGMPLCYILTNTSMFKCTEPNDHIIALLGIAAECSEFEDLVDYNISTDGLYRRLTCAYLTDGQKLGNLWSTHNMVPVDHRRTSSWIPNIEEMASRSALSSISIPIRNFERRIGNACGDTEIQASASGSKLLIRGRIIDVLAQSGTDMSVSELKAPWRNHFTAEYKRRQDVLGFWINECQTMAESAGYDERGFSDAMLFEGFFEPDTTTEDIAAAKKNFSKYRRFQETLAAAPNEATWIRTLESMDWDMITSFNLIEGALWVGQLRRFGRTRYNRIGWMPLVVEEGDYICVFDGMEFPYAVRPRKDPGRNYLLVGDCYFPSLMDGEAMELPGVESVIISLE